MSEWFKDPVLKTGAPIFGAVGSNPTLAATVKIYCTTPKSIAYGKTVPKFYIHIFPPAAKISSPSLVVVWEVMQTERRK